MWHLEETQAFNPRSKPAQLGFSLVNTYSKRGQPFRDGSRYEANTCRGHAKSGAADGKRNGYGSGNRKRPRYGKMLGRGMGMGQGVFSENVTPYKGFTGNTGETDSFTPMTEQELDVLKAQVQEMEQQVKAINERISQMEGDSVSHRRIAVVNTRKCTGCGICHRLCPVSAVILTTVAEVDGGKCTGCGQCVAECPQGAVILQKV